MASGLGTDGGSQHRRAGKRQLQAVPQRAQRLLGQGPGWLDSGVLSEVACVA